MIKLPTQQHYVGDCYEITKLSFSNAARCLVLQLNYVAIFKLKTVCIELLYLLWVGSYLTKFRGR